MNVNEMTYGSIADSYATKYNIPTNVFRSFINQQSGFDPLYNGATGQGIGGLINNSKNPAINMFDPAQQLDIAAQGLSSAYKDIGDWTKAIESFAPTPDQSMVDAMGNPTGATQSSDATNGDYKSAGISGMLDTIKNYFDKYAYSLLMFIVGVVMILATVYMVVRESSEK
jgi:hypothetical protein